MIFLDTCVWFELLGVRTPVKQHEIQQAIAASTLLNKILENQEEIITCKEQLVELISAAEKATMKETSRERKNKQLPGIGNLKDFRKLDEFQQTKQLCRTIINDVKHFAKVHTIGEYDIDNIIQHLDLVDINDHLYCDFCMKANVDFYTFDSDVKGLGEHLNIHYYQVDKQQWS